MAPEKITFLLCGNKRLPQCPTVDVNGVDVQISDDFGGTVKLTREQLDLLVAKWQALRV